MRGFDKLEEGRSRVLVYQVGSNRLYTRMLLDGCIRWIVRWILIRSQWMLVESIGSMCILGGSMYILVDLSWIHVYPVGSLYILVEPLQTLVYPLLDPCRSLQIFSISTCIFIYPLYPYQSTLIHSYPLLSTLIHPIHLFYIF